MPSPTFWALLLTLSLVACGTESPEKPDHGGQHAHSAEHHAGQHSGHPDFKDAEAWAKMFDDPARDAWQKPDEVVKLTALEPGMTVVDLGAGTGYFGKSLSTAVGDRGKLLALDVEPNMVEFMKRRFARDELRNVEARTCPSDGTGLLALSADRVLIVNTWHHLSQRSEYAKHLRGIVRPGGKVLIVEFTQETKKGPPQTHRVKAEQLVAELTEGGFQSEVLQETLPDQYVVMGTVPSSPAGPQASASTAAPDSETLPPPEEPWFSDKSDRHDDCVAPLVAAPSPHFPAPFQQCDTAETSRSSPPSSGHLHFHYRKFSTALTTKVRKRKAGVCCYMVWAFPYYPEGGRRRQD